jgi:acyl-CoA synthetase (NDP forming)
VSPVISRARQRGQSALSEAEAKQVLVSFGIEIPRSRIFAEGQPIVVDGLRFPLVAKIVSADALHKTELGGVSIGLADEAALTAAVAVMRGRINAAGMPLEGWLVEEMAPKGVEVVVGGMVDGRFGPVVMFGLGGILVELMADISFRICPITVRDARQMIDELRGAPLLRGWRGGITASQAAMETVLMQVGGPDGVMMGLADDIGELDINPLIVSEHGAVAVDARIILNKTATHGGR